MKKQKMPNNGKLSIEIKGCFMCKSKNIYKKTSVAYCNTKENTFKNVNENICRPCYIELINE